MQAIVNLALPFFALIFTGFAAGKFRIVPENAVSGLNIFVFYFALPALLIGKIGTASLEALLDPRLTLAYFGAGIPLYLVILVTGRWVFGSGLSRNALRALGSTFSNVGFVGLPLVILAFGPEATPPAVLILVVDMVLMVGMTVALLEVGEQGHKGAGAVARTVVLGLIKNPLFLASVIGVALAATAFALPKPLQTYIDLLGAAAGPCALFALGATLSTRPPVGGTGHWDEIVFVCAVKLIVHPALVWYLAAGVFDLPPIWTAVLVVEAALPIAANVYVLGQRYHVGARESSAAILASTAASIVTLSAVLAYFYDRIG